jgi:hypothetical protein
MMNSRKPTHAIKFNCDFKLVCRLCSKVRACTKFKREAVRAVLLKWNYWVNNWGDRDPNDNRQSEMALRIPSAFCPKRAWH